MKFRDREDAGIQLLKEVRKHAWTFERPIILTLPRGGISVGYEIARFLEVPLDVILVRKLGVPLMPEVSFGAVAEGGIVYLDQALVKKLGISRQTIQELALSELSEIERRRDRYRNGQPLPAMKEKTVVLVDDGVANGWTVRASIGRIRKEKPKKIILAIPVGHAHVVEELKAEVDSLICLQTPLDFMAVSLHYQDFRQVGEREVMALIERARSEAKVFIPDGV